MSAQGRERRLARAVMDAQDALWSEISSAYPEAETGDLAPEDARALDEAIERAARAWIRMNAPETRPEQTSEEIASDQDALATVVHLVGGEMLAVLRATARLPFEWRVPGVDHAAVLIRDNSPFLFARHALHRTFGVLVYGEPRRVRIEPRHVVYVEKCSAREVQP